MSDDSSKIVQRIAESLPQNASSQIKSPYDAIAIVVHASMLELGLRLTGLGEDDEIESIPQDSTTLPESWNANKTTTFRYRSPNSESREFLIRVGRLGSNAVVDAIEVGNNQRESFDVSVQDYVQASALPATLTTDSAPDKSSALRAINEIFVSEVKLRELGALSVKLAHKFVWGNQSKTADDETSGGGESSRTGTRGELPSVYSDAQRVPPPASNEPAPGYNPYAPGPPGASRPRVPAGGEPMPRFDDEYDVYRPAGRGSGQPQRNPLSIGHDDLYPQGLGPNDPLRPSLGPGGLRQPGTGGGMHPTFDDPLFGGGQQGLEDPQNPAGARYDPVGPNDPHGGSFNFPGAGHRGNFGGGGFGGRGGFGGFPPGDFI